MAEATANPPKRQMQHIHGDFEAAIKSGDRTAQISLLMEAVLLLAKANQQMLGDLERLRANQWDGRVG